jgi:hypothetical protein
MRANKITFTVTIECLRKDTIPPMLGQVLENLDKGLHEGDLIAEEGDSVTWSIDQEEVNF